MPVLQAMKAAAVIEQYKNGRRDFRGESLRGGNFRGVELSEADFSGCDIRGANFSRANLTGAKFAGAKAGLPKRWEAILLVDALVLIGVSSFFSAGFVILVSLIFMLVSLISVQFNPATQLAVWFGLIFLISFCAVIWRKNILAVVVAYALAYPVVVAYPVDRAVAVAFAVVRAYPVAVVLAVVRALIRAAALTLFYCWLDWFDPWLRKFVIAFAATGGTSFFQANLTEADFTGARLKSTNFNRAILKKTRFKQAIKLELARPGNTLLVNPQIREFLIDSCTGAGKDFVKANLRGAYLDGANLQTANLRLADFLCPSQIDTDDYRG